MFTATKLTTKLGRKIHQKRVELGLSQEQLSERVSLHRTYISEIERGVRNISMQSLSNIAGGLGMSAWELVRDCEEATE
jgi:transcriptional regulator with XRE-family HTH domain